MFYPHFDSLHEWIKKKSDNGRFPNAGFTSNAKASPSQSGVPLKVVRELQPTLYAEQRQPSTDAPAQLLFPPMQTTPIWTPQRILSASSLSPWACLCVPHTAHLTSPMFTFTFACVFHLSRTLAEDPDNCNEHAYDQICHSR